MRFAVDRLDHLVINCRDVEVMASWYQRVLGMEREDFGSPSRVALKFGGQKINLRPVGVPQAEWMAAEVLAAGTQDLCFIVAVAPEEIVGQFHACGVQDRGRAGHPHRRARRDGLGLLPRPRGQPDRGLQLLHLTPWNILRA